MHSFAVLDISPGLGNDRLISDHAYFLREWRGGGGGVNGGRTAKFQVIKMLGRAEYGDPVVITVF